ncbi:hypothetical protein HXX76_013920 [Chlamydomonas incerta]|uniref:Inosine/uridine-preferring nucleoside hydrolase domain-containing protein n=1 Tax=Chlamydomonas incerta TaxID=51695 RepID=A0A835SSN0_CHLIN|nr:hypothetical protein HXX76_013920 [Chlamydomonas incerta]|eukprot:KAG2425166.1 hypothetical protein HXX76_013920 [Chlamydomonas incerta]
MVLAAAAAAPGHTHIAGVSVVRGNVAAPDALVNAARILLAYPHPSDSGGHHPPQPEGTSTPASASTAANDADGSNAGGAGAGGSSTGGGGGGSSGGWLLGGLPLWLGADAPLAAPPQPLGSYYGRDGLGDVPHLPPSRRQAEAALAQARPLPAPQPLLDASATAGATVAEAEPNAAAAALVAAAQQAPGQLVVVALGPLTNLAAALRLASGLPRLLRGLVVLGGGEADKGGDGDGEGDGEAGGGGGGNVTPWAEFNFYQDPEAVDVVMRAFARAWGCSNVAAPPRLLLVTWRACKAHVMAWADVDRLMAAAAVAAAAEQAAAEQAAAKQAAGAAGGEEGRFLAGVLRPFLAAWRAESPQTGMLLGDPLAAAVALGMADGGGGGGGGCGGGGGGGGAGGGSTGEGPAEAGPEGADGAAAGPTASTLVRGWRRARCSVVLAGERRGMSVLRPVPAPLGAGPGAAALPVPPGAAAAAGSGGQPGPPLGAAAGGDEEEEAALVAVAERLDVAAVTRLVLAAACAD